MPPLSKHFRSLPTCAALIGALFLAFGLSNCSRCNEETPTVDIEPTTSGDSDITTPDDTAAQALPKSAFRRVRKLVDGKMIEYLEPIEGRTKPAAKTGPEPPPDASMYLSVLDTPTVHIVNFPEYPKWDRMSSHGYGVLDRATQTALFIDPGIASVRMMRFWAEQEKARVVAIVVTHGHLDHTGGVAALKADWPEAAFIAPSKDADWLQKPDPAISKRIHADLPPKPDRRVDDGDVIDIGETTLAVIATPGHTVGSVCYYEPELGVLFTGDTLFHYNIGRTNSAHSLTKLELIQNIRTAFANLPDKTMILPGHGPNSRLGEERKGNAYLTNQARPNQVLPDVPEATKP